MITKKSIILASLAILLAFVSINAQPLKSGFVNPPESARPWVMWFWVNGNITKTGITADLEAMKRVGIGGVIIFDVIKDAPLGANEFGTAKWYELFKFMLQEANRLGLKVNMNNDAGWCGSGGPWVPVEKSMQKIVWTETIAQGSNTFKAKLKQPLAVKNYYEDIMVLAFPTPEGDDKKLSDYNPEVKCSTTTAPFEGKNLIDGNSKTNIELAIPTLQKPQIIDFVYPQPFTSRFMTIDLLKNKWSVRGTLMVSEDGLNFKTVKEFEGAAPTISFEFNEQTARWYRISFNEIVNKQIVLKKIGISDFDISNTRLHAIPQKAMFKPIPDFLSVNNIIKIPTDYQSIDTKFTVPINKVLNITDKMTSDGTIAWDVPQGKWTILRIGHTTTGKVNHPAPESGTGYECDKLSKDASTLFFDGFVKKLTQDSKDLVGKSFVSTHIDSWEVGAQNWTPGFLEEFKKRRGYDPVSYFPAMMGIIINNQETSERFLWDIRTTISELMLENYVENISNLAHKNGIKLSIEAYNKCMTDEMCYAGRADEPMAEFWAFPKFNFDWSCTEMASSAHTYGKKIVGAEAFTSGDEEAWLSHPANIKELGDWAFCEGINRFVFHRYAMQPYENIKPGISMGPFGLHYERTQTWWEQSVAWHQYLSRCQYLLQQGLFVADVCYIAPELTPQTWKAPTGRDSVKYKFDGCTPEVVLTRMSVKDGRIMLPDGMNYKLLVMPATETMTPKLLRKIKELIEAGATVVGAPPRKALGLSNYPHSDEEIQKLVAELLGKCDGVTVKENRVGKGRVIMGKTPEEVMAEMKIERDFTSKEFLRFIHRNIDGTEVYFVANPTKNAVNTTCQFRVQGMQPQLWNPMNGKTEKVAQYEELNGTIKMPISLAAEGSVFVVFQPENKTNIAVKNIVLNGEEQNIPITQNDNNGFEMNLAQAGKYTLTSTDDKTQTFEVKNLPQPLEIKSAWEVRFISGMSAPAKTTFPELISWSESKDESIKCYSGSAIYTNTITMPKEMIGKNKSLKLDLGKVAIMAEVKINGKALGILWKAPFCIDITEVAKAGKNSIEIKVVNLWVNRMIGDEQLPDDSKRSEKGTLLAWPQWVLDGKSDPNGRNTFTTWKLWKKDAALVESGLIGPVSIISEEHITLNR